MDLGYIGAALCRHACQEQPGAGPVAPRGEYLFALQILPLEVFHRLVGEQGQRAAGGYLGKSIIIGGPMLVDQRTPDTAHHRFGLAAVDIGQYRGPGLGHIGGNLQPQLLKISQLHRQVFRHIIDGQAGGRNMKTIQCIAHFLFLPSSDSFFPISI